MPTTNPHKAAPYTQRHSALCFSFGTAVARRAQSGLTADDLGKEAMQTDTTPATFWKIIAVSGGTATWSRVDSGAESVLSAVGTILGAEPAWWIDGVSSTIVDAGSSLASSASDASGHGVDATFASGARPLIVVSGLNGKKTLRFTSSQYGGNSGFAAPAPGATPTYTFMVVKSTSVGASSVFLSTGGNSIYVGSGSRPSDYNGNAGGASGVMTAGTWYILECLRSSQSTDYVQLGGAAGLGTANAGNAANTGFVLNATSAGAQGGDNEYATAFQWVGTPPTGPQRTALRAWANSVWGV